MQNADVLVLSEELAGPLGAEIAYLVVLIWHLAIAAMGFAHLVWSHEPAVGA